MLDRPIALRFASEPSASVPKEPPAAPPPADSAAPPAQKEDDDSLLEKVSRQVGHVGQAASKVPRVVAFIPNFLRFAVLDAFVPLVGFAAVTGGVCAFVGVGAAGIIEMVEGVRKKDAVLVLSGAGETSRGLFLGTVAANAIWGPGAYAGLGVGCMYLSGALGIACGAMKIRRGRARGDKKQSVDGALEAGMGVCSLVATSGALLYPAIAVQGALGAARFAYANQDRLRTWSTRVGDRLHTTWENFKDLFRARKDADAKPAAG